MDWPAFLPDALKSLTAQLERSEWAPPAAIAAAQFRHVRGLSEHCARHSPHFSQRLAAAHLSPTDLGTPEGLARLPVMTRRDIQAAGSDLYCREVPPGHGAVRTAWTSGSTGEPVHVRRTAVTALFWNALTMREMRWHGRPASGRLCCVTPTASERSVADDWGPPTTVFGPTGPMLTLPASTDVPRLIDELSAFRASCLVILPRLLAAILDECRNLRVALPHLRHVLTFGERLSPEVRSDARELLDVAVADCYSSEEFGYLALSCSVSDRYHVMSESVVAEVLDENGRPCLEGQVGRVTITALHNYAMPLVRYQLGDRAEVAAPCACGRGLQTWARVVGRERNLVTMPDGRRLWPITGIPRARTVAPLVQCQLVQHQRHAIEARLVVERSLTAVEEAALRRLFQESLGYPFDIRLAYFDRTVPSARSGKFEEFVCLLEDEGVGVAARI